MSMHAAEDSISVHKMHRLELLCSANQCYFLREDQNARVSVSIELNRRALNVWCACNECSLIYIPEGAV